MNWHFLLHSRRPGEESDSDYFRDSSSDGSSDSEHERRCLNYSREQRMYHSQASESSLSIDGLSLRDSNATFQEGFSSDEGESGSSQGTLLFEYLADDQPYSREPLADKVGLFFKKLISKMVGLFLPLPQSSHLLFLSLIGNG